MGCTYKGIRNTDLSLFVCGSRLSDVIHTCALICVLILYLQERCTLICVLSFLFYFLNLGYVKIFEYCFSWCSSNNIDVEIFLWRITYADILLYKMNGTRKALALN